MKKLINDNYCNNINNNNNDDDDYKKMELIMKNILTKKTQLIEIINLHIKDKESPLISPCLESAIHFKESFEKDIYIYKIFKYFINKLTEKEFKNWRKLSNEERKNIIKK
jgi:hypothetical protein